MVMIKESISAFLNIYILFYRTIYKFVAFGRNREDISVQNPTDDVSRERVKFTTMSWTPSPADTEQHILCARAVDNTG